MNHLEQEVTLVKEVKAMLKAFNSYFSYLHGKSEAVDLDMPPAAVNVWVRVYTELTSDERKRAIASVYERHSFHPTPDQFRQLIKGTDEGEALAEWINVLDALRMSQDDAIAKVKLLSPHARKALRVVGGLNGLGMCPEASLHKSVKEDFCRAWKMLRDSITPHPLEAEPTADIATQLEKLAGAFSMPKSSVTQTLS